MVPTTPAAHAGEARVEYHWLGKLARWLELGREKVAILVEEASPGCLRPLVSMLLEREPPVVCFHVTELLDVPAGSLVVLTLHEAELNWINLNRPIIANKRLRLVLWLDFPLHRLKAKAPDFFDWISHIVRCPRLPPQLTVRKLRDARAALQPVAWRGKDLDSALDRIGEGLIRIEARGTFAQLVAAVEKVGDRVPVWTDVHDTWHLLRVELAMHQAGRSWWIVEHPGTIDPRYALVDDETSSWEDATLQLGPTSTVAERSAAACIAALLENDLQGVQSSVLARSEGQSFDEVLAKLRSAPPRSSGTDPLAHAPAPMFAELLRRHARALHDDRSSAWIAAADCARLAGHADVARYFGERALVRSRSEAWRNRAKLALAAADREAGAHAQAHKGFFELVQAQALGSDPEHDPRLAVVLTEEAALLAYEEQHAAAAADAAQAIEIWEARPWRPLDRAHLAALRAHARCMVAHGRGAELSEWLAQRSIHWPPGEEGAAHLELERARSGDRHALERVARCVRHPPPEVCIESIGLELAELQLEQGGSRAVVASCVLVLRSLRARHGTDLHPRWDELVTPPAAPTDPKPVQGLVERGNVEALLSELEAPAAGLGDRSDLHRLASDPQALEMFIVREAPRLEWFFRHRGLGDDSARELTQETLLELVALVRHGTPGGGSPHAVLRRIASGRLSRQRMSSRSTSTEHRPDPDAFVPPQLPEPAASDARLGLERILGQLSPLERAVVELRAIDHSWSEIADTLGMNAPAVRSLHARCIQRLRRQWSLR